jgi:hypothetical protein
MDDVNAELVDRGDLDELIRQADRWCRAGAWDELADLRDRSRAAFERGRQLWPAASRAEYLLALRAPAAWAGAVVVDGAGLFAPGPLAEVVAATHAWAELEPHVPPGPLAAVVLHERVLRGEDLLAAADALDEGLLDIPAVLQPWEPIYPLATYHDDRPPAIEDPRLPEPAESLGTPARWAAEPDDGVEDALRELVRPWLTASEGRAHIASVAGGVTEAIAATGVDGARIAPLEPAEALAYLAWTGASGGAHGRRRGAATGRLNAWWAAAALADIEWPVVADELGEAIAELRWWRWEEPAPGTGWRFHLAVEDPDAGLAWAIAAHDHRTPA